MKVSKSNNAKIARERTALISLLSEIPDNPIPWAAVIRIAAPIIARLAVRFALKKVSRSLSEDKVNTIGAETGAFVSDIITRRTSQDG